MTDLNTVNTPVDLENVQNADDLRCELKDLDKTISDNATLGAGELREVDNASNAVEKVVEGTVKPQVVKTTTYREVIKEKYQIEFLPPDKVENVKCEAVTEGELPNLLDVTKRMLNTLTDIRGAGLAGPQIGINKSFFVWWKDAETPQVVYNPIYYPESSSWMHTYEKCLTYGANFYRVKRFKRVRAVWYENENDKLVKKIRVMAGNDSIVYQHETDHLKGLTIGMIGELLKTK